MLLTLLRRLFSMPIESPLLSRRKRREAAKRRARERGGPHWTEQDRHERPRDDPTNVGRGF